MNTTPRQVRTWGIRVLVISGGGAVVVLAAWVMGVLSELPTLALMVYSTLLAGAVVGAMSAAAASCHMAIGRAFAAGLRAGGSDPQDVTEGPALRLVE